MEDSSRIKAVAVLDIFVALFILFIGTSVILFGTSWADYVDMTTSYAQGQVENSIKWLEYTTWIVYFIGLAAMIYAVKRILDDVLKMFTN